MSGVGGSSESGTEMESSFDKFSDFKSEGELERKSPIDINFDILDQVSSQLYRNPRRAVEELVCNSYDAGATECFVVTPESEEDRLYVLDNGESMDEDGLDHLWDIADSPKKQLEEEDEDRTQNGRQQIGKFGIGKLAAYAVGSKLTHVATRGDRTRVVTVAKGDLEGRDFRDPPKCEVYGMDREEATESLRSHLNEDNLPNPWEKEGDEWESWTLAIVDDIRSEVIETGFKAQYLHPMIRTAIPLSTNFEVTVNGTQIESRAPGSDPLCLLTLGENDEFVSHLEADLKEAWKDIHSIDDDEEVPEERYKCENTMVEGYEEDQDPMPGISIPDLGPVSGTAGIYEETLTSPKREKRDVQDHGYRIRVRGSLVNRGEPLFDTPQKSYKYWARFLAELEIPELDEALLLQRDSINESTIESRLTRELFDSIFNFLRSKARKELESEGESRSTETFFKRLSTLSPHKAPEALQGLTEAEGVTFPEGGWEDVDVEFKQLLGVEELARYDGEHHTIQINTNHELLTALDEEEFPESSREAVGEALAGQLLSIGYLRHNKVNSELIEGTTEIVSHAARSAAKLIQSPTEHHRERLRTTVSQGSDPFEDAVADALLNLGLDVEQHGGPDKPDGIIEISRPGQNFRVGLEMKGGDQQKTDHKETSISTMQEHASDFDCHHSIVISSEEIFQLRGRSEDENSSLIDQVNQHEDISLMTIDMISKMIDLHQRNPYDYTQLKNIFEMRSPEGENRRVSLQKEVDEEGHEELFTPRDGDDRPVIEVSDLSKLAEAWWSEMPRAERMVRTILEVANEKQKAHQGKGTRPRVGMILGEEPIMEEEISDDDIEAVLSSAALTGLAWIDEGGKHYEIYQDPDEIIEKMSVE